MLQLKAETKEKDKENSLSEFSFEIDIQVPFILKFEYLVSSEAGYDFFIVYVNNKEVYKDSGEKKWNNFEIKLSPGKYTISLVYKKDWTKYEGKDAVLIDNIVVKYSF